MTAKTLSTRLAALTLAQLANAYNLVSPIPVKKFSDRPAAERRTLKALEAAKKDFALSPANGAVYLVDPGTNEAKIAAGDTDARLIEVLVDNPKRGKSADRFKKYGPKGSKTTTIAAYAEAIKKDGGTRRSATRDIAYDVAHGFIKLHG